MPRSSPVRTPHPASPPLQSRSSLPLQSDASPATDGDVAGAVVDALNVFVAGVIEALPSIVAGVVFLAVAAVLVWAIMRVVEFGLARALPAESPVYRDFVATLVRLFLWFGVALTFLSVLGLDQIAASLGTATGFVALGVAYATSDMIADAVAGVYLLRDPDFNPGDRVETAKATGVVGAIELRKTRFDVDGDTVVVANAAIEDNWTKLDGAGAGADGTAAGASAAE
jgi:small-conductance mechanosensitive channel